MLKVTMNFQKRFFKNATPLMFVLLISFLIPTNSFSKDTVKINANRITDKVVVYNIEGLQSTNIIVIDTDKGLVVIDSETSPVFAEAIRKSIEKSSNGKPIRFLINTHDHGDHTYGNQMFADIPIIGHERCKEEMIKNQMKARQTSNQITNVLKSMKMKLGDMDKDSDEAAKLLKMIAYYEPIATGLGDNFVLTTPEITFSDKLHLDLGDVNLSLIYFGFSHSASDIIIFCPEEKLLVTGDLFSENSGPYFDSERIPYIARWKQTLEALLVDTSKIRYIVPGHGKMLPISLLVNNLKIIGEKQKEFEGKKSAFFEFKKVYETKGLEASIQKMKALKSDSQHYYFLHPEFDTYTYRLMKQDKLSDALEIFALFVEFFPESYIAFDSLGEAYLRKGDKERARKYFSRSLELNPENQNARNRIEELKRKRVPWIIQDKNEQVA